MVSSCSQIGFNQSEECNSKINNAFQPNLMVHENPNGLIKTGLSDSNCFLVEDVFAGSASFSIQIGNIMHLLSYLWCNYGYTVICQSKISRYNSKNHALLTMNGYSIHTWIKLKLREHSLFMTRGGRIAGGIHFQTENLGGGMFHLLGWGVLKSG